MEDDLEKAERERRLLAKWHNPKAVQKPEWKKRPAEDDAEVKAKASRQDKSENQTKEKEKEESKGVKREAAGKTWFDPSLSEWDPNDFRIFVGDLGKEVTDQMLQEAFARFASFKKAKVVKEQRTGKSKGYGFVSFSEADDFLAALREVNGKYIGSRPCKLRRSNWKDRSA